MNVGEISTYVRPKISNILYSYFSSVCTFLHSPGVGERRRYITIWGIAKGRHREWMAEGVRDAVEGDI